MTPRKPRADAGTQVLGTSSNAVHSWRPAPVTLAQLADLAAWWGTAGEGATLAQCVALAWVRVSVSRQEQQEASNGNG